MVLDTPGQKKVYTVHSHNQALEAWEKSPGLNVFSLDYHTDTKKAFQNYSYWRADSEARAGSIVDTEERIRELTGNKIRGYLSGDISLQSINDNLKHDEHLDFAVRTDMVEQVFIVSKDWNTSRSNPRVHVWDENRRFEGERIIEYSPLRFDGAEGPEPDFSIEDSILGKAVSKAEALVPSFFEDFILDIDCDYFNSEESLRKKDISVFNRLVRKAAFITIALEPECVKICRLDGSAVDSPSVHSALLTLIEEAV